MHEEFALFNAQKRADWERWARRNVEVVDDTVTLATTPTLQTRPLDATGVDLAPVPSGDVVLLDPDGGTGVYMQADDLTRRLELEDAGLDAVTILGATRDRLYLVDESDGTIGVFSRRTRRLERTRDDAVDPVAAVGTTRRLYLLDGGETDENGFVLAFEPDGTSETVFRRLESPLDLTLDDEGTLYVLDGREDGAVLMRSTGGGTAHGPLMVVESDLPEGYSTELVAAWTPGSLLLYGRDDAGDGLLLVYDLETAEVESRLSPDRELAGLTSPAKGGDGQQQLVYARTIDGAVVVVEQERKNRKDPGSLRYEGHLVGRFDSGERGLEWHRLAFDVSRATSGSHVDVQYYASDGGGTEMLPALPGMTTERLDQLATVGVESLWDLIEYTPGGIADAVPELSETTAGEWLDEVEKRLRREFERRDDTHGATTPVDILLREATGRYLHVKITLVGNRQSAPELDAVSVYCPRKSYLRYLPEIYRQTDRNSNFLARFLSIFETVYTDIEANIDRSTKYIDAYEIPKDYFPWLNRWFGGEAVLGRAWPEQAQRELLERSTELYKLRGTKRGLLELIGLYLEYVDRQEPAWDQFYEQARARLDELVDRGFITDDDARDRLAEYEERTDRTHEDEIVIREYEDVERIENDELRGQYADLFGHPRRFQVLIRPTLGEQHVEVIKNIVRADKPVYTDVYVERLPKNFRMNTNTYLGINTYLPETRFVVGSSTLGSETWIERTRTTKSTSVDIE